MLARLPIRRPRESAPPSYACPKCDFVLYDGVAYSTCPRCDRDVDWVDLQLPIWACPSCDAMKNANIEPAPACAACERAMILLRAEEKPSSGDLGIFTRIEAMASSPRALAFFALLIFTPLLTLALDAHWRAAALAFGSVLFGPLFVLAAIILFLGAAAVPAIVSVIFLRTTRVVHGIEHATAHLLEREGFRVLGGVSHERGFFLDIDLARSPYADHRAIARKVRQAISRVKKGERALAYHPRCGTSFAVVLALVTLLVVFAGVSGLARSVSPLGLAAMIAAAFGVLVVAGPKLGLFAQKVATVSTDFLRVKVEKVDREIGDRGRIATWGVRLNTRLRRGP